jgi:hypothetical protein
MSGYKPMEGIHPKIVPFVLDLGDLTGKYIWLEITR